MPPAVSSTSTPDPIIKLCFEERGGWNWAPRMEISIGSDGLVKYISTDDLKKWADSKPFVTADWKPNVQEKFLTDTELDRVVNELSLICAHMPKRHEYLSPSGAVITMLISSGGHTYTLITSDYSFIKEETMDAFRGVTGYENFAGVWTKFYDIIKWAVENGETTRMGHEYLK